MSPLHVAATGAGVATVATRSEKSKMPRALQLLDPRHRGYYADYNRWIEEMAAVPGEECFGRPPPFRTAPRGQFPGGRRFSSARV